MDRDREPSDPFSSAWRVVAAGLSDGRASARRARRSTRRSRRSTPAAVAPSRAGSGRMLRGARRGRGTARRATATVSRERPATVQHALCSGVGGRTGMGPVRSLRNTSSSRHCATGSTTTRQWPARYSARGIHIPVATPLMSVSLELRTILGRSRSVRTQALLDEAVRKCRSPVSWPT